MPYLFGAAVEAHSYGLPTMRAMMLEFPDDPGCDTLDRQYLLGDALMVAPVFSADGVVDYYLPAGRWTNFFTGHVVEGGHWVREKHGYLSLPLMVRPNTILPVGNNDQVPDYDFTDGVTFHIFELEEGTVRRSVPGLNGEEALVVTATHQAGQVSVETQGKLSNWSVLLRGVSQIQSVVGAQTQTDPLGLRLVAEAGAKRLTIQLL